MRFTRNQIIKSVFIVIFVSILAIGVVSLVWHVMGGSLGAHQTYATVMSWDIVQVDEDTFRHVTVQYRVDGVTYEGVLEYWAGRSWVDTIRISYNPDNPSEITVAYGPWFVWLVPAIGLAGLILEFAILPHIRRRKQL